MKKTQPRVRVFLDTSAIISAIFSETGGSRQLLKLGEAGLLSLWIGPHVMDELDAVIARKSPGSKGFLAFLMTQAKVSVSTKPVSGLVTKTLEIISYEPDSLMVAEAISANVDYLVTYNRRHILSNPNINKFPFTIGTAGDFLNWFKQRITGQVPY